MDLLIAGVSLWIIVHFVPGLGPELKKALVNKLGNLYRGLFTLLIIISIALMVMGWQAVTPTLLYSSPEWAQLVTKFLMFFALYLLACAKGQATVRHYIRHPMLMGVGLWAAAHLLSNGDSRSVILFGGFLIWTMAQTAIINNRDGEWQRPDCAPLSKDIRKLVSTAILYVILIFGHPYFTGLALV